MAKVPNAVKILPKIWTAWVGRTSVTDRRQTTDGRAIAYSEREREFTFANNNKFSVKRLASCNSWMALKVAQNDWNFRCSIGHRFYFVVCSNNVSIVRSFRECKWLPVTFGSPSVSMKQLKLQVTLTLRLRKRIVVNNCYISRGIGVSKFQTVKVTFKVIGRLLVPFDRPHTIFY